MSTLLDELIALHTLLNDEDSAISPNRPEETHPMPDTDSTGRGKSGAIPLLKEKVAPPLADRSRQIGNARRASPEHAAGTDIPVLNEVVDQSQDTDSHSLAQGGARTRQTDGPPEMEELLQRVDALVERHLQRLKPGLTRQIIKELQAIYPSLSRE